MRGGSIFTIFTAAEVFKCSSAKLVANLEQLAGGGFHFCVPVDYEWHCT